jgi:hypothetical protein
VEETVVVTVCPGPVCVVVTVCPGAVREVVVVTVFVELGLISRSAPNPNPMPTTPAAASAPVHFNIDLLEVDLFRTLSSSLDKILFT